MSYTLAIQRDLVSASSPQQSLVICAYTLSQTWEGRTFARYLLIQDNDTRTLKFITAKGINCGEHCVEQQLKTYVCNPVCDLMGLLEDNGTTYIFVQVTMQKEKEWMDTLGKRGVTTFALAHEVMMLKHVCNEPIDSLVTDFFLRHPDACRLLDRNGRVLDNPVVGFVGTPTTSSASIALELGESPSLNTHAYGGFYQFTDFQHAVWQGTWSPGRVPQELRGKQIITDEHGKYFDGCVVRFALWLGHTKYVEDTTNDESCNWTEGGFDSVYVGASKLIVVKSAEQHVPLSYHRIELSSVGDQFEPEGNYSVKRCLSN